MEHKETKKFLQESGLVLPDDYIRAVDNNGWTDLNFDAANKFLSNASSYIICSSFGQKEDEEPQILINQNFQELYHELSEQFVGRGSFDQIRNRVFGYFVDTNVIRIGNKSNCKLIQFEPTTIKSLAFRKSCGILGFDRKTKHETLQWHLIVLGNELGFDVMVANNDKHRQIEQGQEFLLHAPLKVSDLSLSKLVSKQSKKVIRNIDVIWVDKITKKAFSAFEVELSGNLVDAIGRLAELKHNISDGYVLPIIVVDQEDVQKLCQLVNLSHVQQHFGLGEIRYLTVENLVKALRYVYDISYKANLLDLHSLFFDCLVEDFNLLH